MSKPRPSAKTLSVFLLVMTMFTAVAAPSALGRDPNTSSTNVISPDGICTAGQMPTQWQDDVHPPNTIRVLRHTGPNAGHVETVPFWNYVAVVMRAEYSTGADRPPLWMRIGAITVKQYGWFYAMTWRGGRISHTMTNPDGTTTTTNECYDVKDGTSDQIYKPEQWNADHTVYYKGNIPTPAIEKAMRETWHISLRKWNAKKARSRLFLTGYRSGQRNPCGADATGFKIYQQSLRDCLVKNLTTYETIRRYFEPTFVVNTRDHDMIGNNTDWMGDLGTLQDAGNGNSTWRIYGGGPTQFAAPVSGTFNGLDFASLVGYGAGNVDAARDQVDDYYADPALFADLIMVTNDNRVLVSRSQGGTVGLSPNLVATPYPRGAATKAVFADFNGDMLTDVGLLRPNGPGQTWMAVMLANGDGTFAVPAGWWSGPLDLATSLFVGAGDVNGDGMADLITRDATGTFMTALSRPSCASFASWGPCPAAYIGSAGLGSLTTALNPPAIDLGAGLVVGDIDRDGRDDVIAVSQAAGRIMFIAGRTDGTFASAAGLWTGPAASLAGQPVALNINADGMTDLALVQPTAISWFRTNERTAGPASMTKMGTLTNTSMSGQAPF